MAWLNATPQSKSKDVPNAPHAMSRLQELRANSKEPQLPPEGAASHLVDYLFEAGPIVHGSNALGWIDIQAWQASTGVALEAWQARALRKLSHAYLDASIAAQSPECAPFWPPVEQPTPDKRKQISSALRNILGSQQKAH